MTCQFCGKELPAEACFCTGCGKALKNGEIRQSNTTESKDFTPSSSPKKQSSSVKLKKNFSQYLEPIDQFIQKLGGPEKISRLTLPLLTISLIAIRLLGGLICALLLTLCNAYLLYVASREQGKINIGMLAWTVAIFIIGWTF